MPILSVLTVAHPARRQFRSNELIFRFLCFEVDRACPTKIFFCLEENFTAVRLICRLGLEVTPLILLTHVMQRVHFPGK